MDIFIQPWQSFYFIHNSISGIYKCNLLGMHYDCLCRSREYVLGKESSNYIIRLPDAALNRLSKVTGYDYLSRGYIRMIPYGPDFNRVPIHIYKNSEYLCRVENGNLGICKYNDITNIYEYGPDNPWLPHVSIEYISGIGIPLSAGFADIIVTTIIDGDC